MIDKILGLLIVLCFAGYLYLELSLPARKIHFLKGSKLDAYLEDFEIHRKVNESDIMFRERALNIWEHEDDSEGHEDD
jgi:hypothetical protein